jgi:hypothetical protein
LKAHISRALLVETGKTLAEAKQSLIVYTKQKDDFSALVAQVEALDSKALQIAPNAVAGDASVLKPLQMFAKQVKAMNTAAIKKIGQPGGAEASDLIENLGIVDTTTDQMIKACIKVS